MKRMVMAMGVVLAAAVSGCDKPDAKAQLMKMMQRPPASVTVASATSKDVPVYLEEIGRTVSMETVAIVPQVGGKIVATHVEDGQDITKGQLLFEIDARPFEAALASVQAALEKSRADLAKMKADLSKSKVDLAWARVEFGRVEDLKQTATISQMEYDQKKNAVQAGEAIVASGEAAVVAGEAGIAAQEAAVRTAKLNLEYTKIYSPIDGRAGARLVDAGNVVKENDKPMLVIQKLDPIYAEFTVTENDLGTVRKFIATAGLEMGLQPEKGLQVEVDVPGDSGRILGALGKPAAATQPGKNRGVARVGTLTFLDNSVQDGSGTVKVRATVANEDHYFWPGQFVKVKVVLTTAKGAVLIPATAVQIGQGGPFVYVVKQGESEDPKTKAKVPARVAELREIQLGQRHGEMVVVRKNLAAGEQVVVTGQMMVMKDMPVMVIDGEAPKASPPAEAGKAQAAAK